MKKTVASVSALIFAAILLAGCALAPIQSDQSVFLKGNEGLAAIAFSMPEPIENVYIVPANAKDGKLLIDDVPKGKSIYLFVVPAGKYCLDKFTSYSKGTDYKPVGHAGPCFQVPVGKLSYSGVIGPYSVYGQLVMLPKDDHAAFNKLLRSKYPKIAARFLTDK